jgi:predicted DNA-binding transcriptional regulator YafY
MRADRLLSILLQLQVHKRVTARSLARRLEVSERTIYRDMDALGASGVPVYAERGAGGGWSLLEPYKTNLTGLNHAEIRSLFLSTPAHVLSDLGLRQAAEAALSKLLASIPSGSVRDAEYARQRIYVDTSGWRSAPEDVAALAALQEAIWCERMLRFVYRRASECDVERTVGPLGLVAKGSAWYLVAAVEGQVRTYRVSRIASVERTDVPFERASDFDLEAYWKASAAEFDTKLPRYYATIRVAPGGLPWVWYRIRTSRIERQEGPDADGLTTFELRFDVEEEAAIFVLGLGDLVEVLAPDALRTRVVATAARLVARYPPVQPERDTTRESECVDEVAFTGATEAQATPR